MQGPKKTSLATGTDEYVGQQRALGPQGGEFDSGNNRPREQVRQIFIEGNQLIQRWRQPAPGGVFTVLALGFGPGIHFLETLGAWRDSQQHGSSFRHLHYVALDARPLSVAELTTALTQLDFSAAESDELRRQWPVHVNGLRRWSFADQVSLTLCVGPVDSLLANLSVTPDAVFLDERPSVSTLPGGAQRTLRQIGRLASTTCTLASRLASSNLTEQLAGAGFLAQEQPTAGASTGHLTARFTGLPAAKYAPPPPPHWPKRHAVIVGAGLAGVMISRELSKNGWQITLLEKQSGPLQAASNQPALACHVHLSPDDNMLARLCRNAWFHARSQYPDAVSIGRLMRAKNARQAASYQQMLSQLDLPTAFATWLGAAEASEKSGVCAPQGGIWMAESLVLYRESILRLCDDQGLQWRYDQGVARVEHNNNTWIAFDQNDQILAKAPVMILADGSNPGKYLASNSIQLQSFRGQTTVVGNLGSSQPRSVVSDDAYLCPLANGHVITGASFDQRASLVHDPADDAANLNRMRGILGRADLAPDVVSSHVGIRVATHDRMPVIGEMPDEKTVRQNIGAYRANDRLPMPVASGLFTATGFGSRGMLWAPLAARLIADTLSNTPSAIEVDLQRAISPTRFMRNALRKGTFN